MWIWESRVGSILSFDSILEKSNSINLSVFLWSIGYWFSIALVTLLLCHQKLNSSPSFITLSIPIPRWTSRRPRCPLPPGDLGIIRLGHLLSFMHTTCPYHFNILLNRNCFYFFGRKRAISVWYFRLFNSFISMMYVQPMKLMTVF